MDSTKTSMKVNFVSIGHDPGWNDPPQISYERGCEITANASTKRILNKRVSVPMNAPYRTGQGGIDPTLPPLPIDAKKIGTPPTGGAPPPPPSAAPAGPGPRPPSVDTNLRDCLPDVLHNIRSCTSGIADDEISKRITVMENMWLDNKFDVQVMKKIIELSNVLKRGDVEAADRMQKGLMVDHISQCSSWMGGIRQLITQIQSAQHTD